MNELLKGKYKEIFNELERNKKYIGEDEFNDIMLKVKIELSKQMRLFDKEEELEN